MFASTATIFSGVLLLLSVILYILAGLWRKESGDLLVVGEPTLKQKSAMALKVRRRFAVRCCCAAPPMHAVRAAPRSQDILGGGGATPEDAAL